MNQVGLFGPEAQSDSKCFRCRLSPSDRSGSLSTPSRARTSTNTSTYTSSHIITCTCTWNILLATVLLSSTCTWKKYVYFTRTFPQKHTQPFCIFGTKGNERKASTMRAVHLRECPLCRGLNSAKRAPSDLIVATIKRCLL